MRFFQNFTPLRLYLKSKTRYISKGKKLRSMLMEEVAKLLAVEQKKQITTLGLTLEFIHNVTICHDDVIDLETIRRGEKTLNAVSKNKNSIFFGDYLLTFALERFTRRVNIEIQTDYHNKILEVCQGEVQQDINNNLNKPISLSECIQVARLKTGSLFSLSFKVPIYFSLANHKLMSYAEECGYIYGIIYQLLDDMKDLANDIVNRNGIHNEFKHWTYPSVLWIKKSRQNFIDFFQGKTLVVSDEIKSYLEKKVEATILTILRELVTKLQNLTTNAQIEKNGEAIVRIMIEKLKPFTYFPLLEKDIFEKKVKRI